MGVIYEIKKISRAPDKFLFKTNKRYLNDNILTTILKRHLRIF